MEYRLRTLEEVRQRYECLLVSRESVEPGIVGFEAEDLTVFIPGESPAPLPLTEEAVLGLMRECMAQAWENAIAHRGNEASLSVSKLSALLWVLGNEMLRSFVEDEAHFTNYGVPILRKISQRYGFEIPVGARDWADGRPCRAGCSMGCVPPDVMVWEEEMEEIADKRGPQGDGARCQEHKG